MMMRTKEVIMSSSDGSTASVVMRASSCSVRLYCVPPLPPVTLTMGRPWDQAASGKASNKKMARGRQKLSFMGDFLVTRRRPIAQGCDLSRRNTDQDFAAANAHQGDFLTRAHADSFNDLELPWHTVWAHACLHAFERPEQAAQKAEHQDQAAGKAQHVNS